MGVNKMWVVVLSRVRRGVLLRWATTLGADLIRVESLFGGSHAGHSLRLHNVASISTGGICMGYSTSKMVENNNSEGTGTKTLARDLACLVEESSVLKETRSNSRMELKRALENRIKKRVKEQYINGKFHDLMMKVIACPETLKDAYHCIRLNSNVDEAEQSHNISFDSLAEELHHGRFDVSANTFSISTKGPEKETLVLPKLQLKVVQEAIRIVLEVVYKPHFSKISHGCRSGRGHHTAFKYIIKEITNVDWWFTLTINKKLDSHVLAKLISIMEEKIEDPSLYDLIQAMFDAHVLNVEFGGFPKGHGLPQEGVLSPIFLNIYLGVFDSEFYRLSMKYEALNSGLQFGRDGLHSYLRNWFRRQLKDNDTKTIVENSGSRIHCCRSMDELVFAVSGSKDIALNLKLEIEDYLQNSLHLDVDSRMEILPRAGPQAIRFLGSLLQIKEIENPAARAVPKLKEKVSLFASQKQEAWEIGTLRIGKKWLAHGLKKVKESEIKHLADGCSLLRQISCFRKAGMKTDHWFKLLLKMWMEDIKAKVAESEEQILSKFVAESAILQELKESFYEFQKRAEDYLQSETAMTLALLPNCDSSNQTITKIVAPINVIAKRLLRYGLTMSKGHSCMVPELILQDHDQIIDWFSGIVQRWHRWYGDCDNFAELELVIGDQVRKSCIRTLAAKYRIHESIIERRFDSDLCRILSTGDVYQMGYETSDFSTTDKDEALMYGVSYSGQCLLSLKRMVSQSRPCNCFVMCCSAAAPFVYTLHVMERQKFPGWKTGFSTCIHPSLNRRRIGLCRQHLKDLYLGSISLQCIDFSSWQ